MKQLFLLLILLSLPLRQPAAQPSELDQLIQALQTKYNGLSSIAADFTQLYHAPGERVRRESGHLLLKKPGKMRWDYTAPESKVFVSDGKWLYEYAANDKVATRTAVREADDLRAPFAFLLGRGNLRRDFKRIEFSNEAPLKAGQRVLRLIPKNAANIRELSLEIEPGSLQLVRLGIIDRNGARSDFRLTNVRENAPASAAQFQFQPPAGVTVVNQ